MYAPMTEISDNKYRWEVGNKILYKAESFSSRLCWRCFFILSHWKGSRNLFGKIIYIGKDVKALFRLIFLLIVPFYHRYIRGRKIFWLVSGKCLHTFPYQDGQLNHIGSWKFREVLKLMANINLDLRKFNKSFEWPSPNSAAKFHF